MNRGATGGEFEEIKRRENRESVMDKGRDINQFGL
jgi:hypothetical protein